MKAVYYLVIVIAIIGILAVSVLTSSPPDGKYDSFAQCLADSGATFYGTFWCPHCRDQKVMFGSSVQYVNYVECSTPDGRGQLPVCNAAGIESYPTWEFADGSRLGGTQSFEALSEKTGCEIVTEQNA